MAKLSCMNRASWKLSFPQPPQTLYKGRIILQNCARTSCPRLLSDITQHDLGCCVDFNHFYAISDRFLIICYVTAKQTVGTKTIRSQHARGCNISRLRRRTGCDLIIFGWRRQYEKVIPVNLQWREFVSKFFNQSIPLILFSVKVRMDLKWNEAIIADDSTAASEVGETRKTIKIQEELTTIQVLPRRTTRK